MNDDQLFSEALSFLDRTRIGVLITHDSEGYPHARWMTTVALDGMSRLITMSADETRKIAHIENNSNVCWLFSDTELGQSLQIKGRAKVNRDLGVTMHMWDHLMQVARNYAGGALNDDEHLTLVTIETQVEQAECNCPQRGVDLPRTLTLR